MKNLQKFGFILCIAAVLTGCASRKNIVPPASFTAQPKKIVIANLSGYENAIYIPPEKQNNNGNPNASLTASLIGTLLEVAVETMAADLAPPVSRLISWPILEEHYHKRFKAYFEGYNFNVVRTNGPLRIEDLKPAPNTDIKFAPFDFTYLKSIYGADYALILQVTKYSCTRFGYMHKPHGRSSVHGYIVNLEDNSIIGEYAPKEVEEYSDHQWDVPPVYYDLTQSVINTLTISLDTFYLGMTGAKPMEK